MPRFEKPASVAIATFLLLRCSSTPEPQPATDAGVHRGVDPFCANREKLTLCEDFDGEASSLPRTRATQGTISVEKDEKAPSPPNVFVSSVLAGPLQAEARMTSARIPSAVQLNLFFQFRLAALGVPVEIASLSASRRTYRLLVDGTGKIFFNDRLSSLPVETPAGSWQPSTDNADNLYYATTLAVQEDAWTSVRWDLYGKTPIEVARTRLRIGEDTAFESLETQLEGPLVDSFSEIGLRVGPNAGLASAKFDNFSILAK